MKFRTSFLLFVLFLSISVPAVFGQGDQSQQSHPSESAAPSTGHEPRVSDEPATLTYQNREIVTLRGEVTGIRPKDRVASAERQLESLSDIAIHQKVETQPLGDAVIIRVGPTIIFSLFSQDVEPDSGKTVQETANQAAANLRNALQARIDQTKLSVILKGIGLSLLGTILFGLIFLLILRIRRYMLERFSRKTAESRERFKLFGVQLHTIAMSVLEALSRLLLLIATLLVAYLWLTMVLRRFPYTYPWGQALKGFLFQIVGDLASHAKRAFPGLATVIVIFFIARVLTRVIKQFFDSMESGQIPVPGIYAETSGATRRIVNALIWVLALVVAYPYFPGSQTDAFKGLSVFIGLMFTLGSAGIVNHLMSGLVLVYSRALKKGDFIRVGEEEGRVLEVGPLSVKIATRKREELTIPNTVMTSSVVTNYSRLSKEDGLILTTTLTIGYDAPWRQVHELLKMAAEKTPGLRKTPAPYVLQTALSDFYVEYRLGVSPEDLEQRYAVLSRLHANIQDAFNAYGVQIMSPHFESQPPDSIFVPKEKWYPAPVKKPDDDKKE